MRDLKDSFTHSGYSFEEYYFHQVNQKLIEQIREKYRNQKVVSLNQYRQDMQAASGSAPPGAQNAPSVTKTKKAA